MCFPSAPKPAAPLTPPPPPPPSATELEQPEGRRKGSGSALSNLRIPLNPTGTGKSPRLGL